MSLASNIAQKLLTEHRSLASAESCTGGLIAHTLTNICGSSSWFKAGTVAYANEIKTRALGVPPPLIKKYGAVSAPVARAMAEGARRKARTDYALSTTGIAGPTGGTATKPVGLVFIAAASARRSIVKKCFFKGSRQQIKRQAAEAAMALLLKLS
ncbi:MAG: CinA family protein [Elusimicrobia bacterium]|nr:CinA family protein [Elusimicrobiota bacterium]